MVKNTLIKGADVRFVESIESEYIVNSYKEAFQIDVSATFKGLERISLFECEATGYQFYAPLDIAGDGKFYESLQTFDWYYMPWKWEHQLSLDYIKSTDRVLEIGSGSGFYLKKLSELGYVNLTGLELNEHSVQSFTDEKARLLLEDIQTHANLYPETYDIVCSYQVMEHIHDIGDVINASLKALRTGGKLIISVPNNSTYLKLHKKPLNMPPHHMGLWNEEMSKKITKYFPMNLVSTHKEPLQNYHINGFYNSVMQIYEMNKIKKKIVNFLFKKQIKDALSKISSSIDGHTIFLVYEKTL